MAKDKRNLHAATTEQTMGCFPAVRQAYLCSIRVLQSNPLAVDGNCTVCAKFPAASRHTVKPFLTCKPRKHQQPRNRQQHLENFSDVELLTTGLFHMGACASKVSELECQCNDQNRSVTARAECTQQFGNGLLTSSNWHAASTRALQGPTPLRKAKLLA